MRRDLTVSSIKYSGGGGSKPLKVLRLRVLEVLERKKGIRLARFRRIAAQPGVSERVNDDEDLA